MLLTDPDRMLLVTNGSVELFVAPVEGDQVVGARHHVASVAAGEVLFGARTMGMPRSLALLLVARPETAISSFPIARARRLIREDDGMRRALCDAIERWVTHLSGVLAVGAVPKRHEMLRAGHALRLEGGTAVRSTPSVLWLHLQEGHALLAGRPEGALRADIAMPLGPVTWLDVVRESVVDASTTEAVLESDGVWLHLEAFHDVVLSAMTDRIEASRLTERQRLRRRADADRAAMSEALVQLSSATVLRHGSPAVGAAAENALVTVFRLVAERQGVEFRRPERHQPDANTLDQLHAIARESRIHLRRVALRNEWWRHDNGPMLAFVEDGNHPVAVLPTPGGRYDLIDPPSGSTRRVTAAIADSLSSFGYVLSRPFPDRALGVVRLLRFGIEATPLADGGTVVGLGIAVGLLALLVPIATGIVFDSIIPSAERGQLLQLTLALVVIALAAGLFRLTQGLAMLRIEGKMSASMQSGVWDRLLRLPAPFFRRYLVGDLARRSLGVDAIRQALTGATLSSLMSGVFSVFSLGLLFYYSGRLALVAVGITLVAFSATLAASMLGLRYERVLQEVSGRIDGLVMQLVNGIAKLRLAGAEVRAFGLWASEFSDQKRVAFRARTVENALETFNASFVVVASMVIFGALVVVLQGAEADGGLSTGAFLAFNAAFGQFLAAMLAMSSVVVSLLTIVPIYERARPILEEDPEVSAGSADPGDLRGDLEVSHVSFRYRDDGPLVLDDVSLRAGPGELVAIVGPSGAGKSTLMRTLLGFERPVAGSVHYDGQDLATLDLQVVRRQMGVVLQHAHVLPGTIFENIVGSAPLSLDQAMDAARMAGLDRDIEHMPMGMHTYIAEGGKTLSGGQRQRLLIARAVVGRPRILLFDEATSAVDNRTQLQISHSLELLRATRIVIAHRLSTIQNADQIYVMDGGRVVQVGTYDELVTRPGAFAELAARQIA